MDGKKVTRNLITNQSNNPSPPPPAGTFKLLIKKVPANGGAEKLLFAGREKITRDRRFSMDGPRVTISNARPRDAGTYYCMFGLQPPVVLRHTIDVQYAPTVRAMGRPEQHIPRGESVTLECQAEGNPEPIIRWSRQEGPLPSGKRSEEVRGAARSFPESGYSLLYCPLFTSSSPSLSRRTFVPPHSSSSIFVPLPRLFSLPLISLSWLPSPPPSVQVLSPLARTGEFPFSARREGLSSLAPEPRARRGRSLSEAHLICCLDFLFCLSVDHSWP